MQCKTFEEFCDCIGAKKDESYQKDLPILFKGAMVKAILNTASDRLPINPVLPYKWQTRRAGKKKYKVGDRLWVRETVRVVDIKNSSIKVCYEADKAESEWIEYPDRLKGKPVIGKCLSYGGFKELSRIWLEVTGVRVESLQAITAEDIRAEGIAVYQGETIVEPETAIDRAVYLDQWTKLWDGINASRGYRWSVNPTVTVIEFDRISE